MTPATVLATFLTSLPISHLPPTSLEGRRSFCAGGSATASLSVLVRSFAASDGMEGEKEKESESEREKERERGRTDSKNRGINMCCQSLTSCEGLLKREITMTCQHVSKHFAACIQTGD